MNQEKLELRSDMQSDKRQPWQHYSSLHLDNFLFKAFTATSMEDVKSAEHQLADVQGQCLRHIHFLSEQESVFRSIAEQAGHEIDEDAYTELVSFISGVGASLTGVSHQLGFSLQSSKLTDAE